MNSDKFTHEYFLNKRLQQRDFQICYFYKNNQSLEFISNLFKLDPTLILFIIARNHLLRDEHKPLLSKYVTDEYPFPPIDQGYIYLIYNDITTMTYVGQTTSTLLLRWTQHLKEWKESPNRKLYEHFSLIGIEHFKIKLLEIVPIEQLNDKEIEWIDKLDTINYGLNMVRKGYEDRQYIKE